MFFVALLALTGLFLIVLECLLSGAIMAIGGGILLAASAFFFHMSHPSVSSLLAYLFFLSSAVYLIVRIFVARRRANLTEMVNALPESVQASIYAKELIGKRGTAATDLIPSGQILLDEEIFDATSNMGSIAKGTQVLVISGKGCRLVVKSSPNHLSNKEP